MQLIAKAIKLFFKQFFRTFARILAFGLAMICLIVFISAMFSEPPVDENELTYTYVEGEEGSANTLLQIPIQGVILTEPSLLDPFSFLSTDIVYGYSVKKMLIQAGEDEKIDGVILHIDSPGGTVTGSKAIADGIAEYRRISDKPIYAYVSGMAASGGYWAMSSADKIVADTGTSIGSIGVIYGPFKYYDGVISEDGGILAGGVVTERGIETTYITAGKSKDLGNPYRELTAEELAVLQGGVDDAYNEFAKFVAQTRSIPEEVVRNQIGALIFGEIQAGNLKLVDAVGNRESVYRAMAIALGDQPNEYEVVAPDVLDSFWGELMALGNSWRMSAGLHQAKRCPYSSMVLAFHGPVTNLCPQP